jgi:phytoene synthase
VQDIKNNKKIRIGFNQARQITKRFAKTFYFASFFLPSKPRLSAYTIYAICRISDESVDNDALLKNNQLEGTKEKIFLAYSNEEINDPLILAFRHTINTYNIPAAYFEELISGMKMDLEKNRYQNFQELYTYCYKVAGVVGLIMLRILGAKNISIDEYAVNLGIAMQLTNILRDIKEDYAKNRIYIPQEDLCQFKVSEDDIANERNTTSFKLLLQNYIRKAREYYRKSDRGVSFISSIRGRMVVLAMSLMYEAILDEIKNNDYNIFIKRAALSKLKKIIIIVKLILKGKYL